MSVSDSKGSVYGVDYKNFKQATSDRLLSEMLQSAKALNANSWKVLIMDKFTVKIMSYACKMADITDEGVSLVEDIYKRRQPLLSMDAIYFIQPTRENVILFLSDMSGKMPLYRKAFVFFCSPVSKELVQQIKGDTSVLSRILALREMNLEYFAIDGQNMLGLLRYSNGISDGRFINKFIYNTEKALEDLYGDDENTRKGEACLNVMAIRIATVFASLREYPFVRYRAAKSLDATARTTFRDLIPTKLAAGVWNCLTKYKQNDLFPAQETCDLLILDRSVDQIAPIIHEWTYDAICHDLLNLEGNKYVHEVPSKTGGPPEKKEVLLEDRDPIWLELRHAHIADASERLHEKMTNFVSTSKAAQMQSSRDGGELSTRDLQKIVQELPQYSELMEKLSLHVEIAGKINVMIREMELRALGQLEQDLVFGDAGTKDVTKFLTTNPDITRENKLRLLMIFAAVYPEKLEAEKGRNLMTLAKLPPEDVTAVNNMRLLRKPAVTKKSAKLPFSLKFDMHKKKHAFRKERPSEGGWALSRFYPMIEELVEKLGKGELSKDDYPCMNDPTPIVHGSSHITSGQTTTPEAHSTRSRPNPTWARRRNSDDGYSSSSDSVPKQVSGDLKKMGKRIFVFIVGGATRAELRVCHKLTESMQREIILGSSSIDDPQQFVKKLKGLVTGTAGQISIDDLEI